MSNIGGFFYGTRLSELSEFYFQTSGRLYMDRNRWRGLSYVYGFSYYQWSQDHGTGAAPAYNVTNSKGYLIPRNSKITNIKIIIDRNNAEAAPFEVDFSIIRGASIINLTTITNTSYNTNNFYHDVDLDFDALEDDMLVFSGRKVGGSGTRRYCQSTMTVRFE